MDAAVAIEVGGLKGVGCFSYSLGLRIRFLANDSARGVAWSIFSKFPKLCDYNVAYMWTTWWREHNSVKGERSTKCARS